MCAAARSWSCASRRNKGPRARVKHIPRKRFGQHFLADGAIIDARQQLSLRHGLAFAKKHFR